MSAWYCSLSQCYSLLGKCRQKCRASCQSRCLPRARLLRDRSCAIVSSVHWDVWLKRGYIRPISDTPPMFTRTSRSGYKDALPGVRFKTLAHGTRTLLTEFHLEKGGVIPRHSHPHEQTGYLVSGALLFTIGDTKFDARPGDCWCVEGNVEHGAVVLEDSVAIEMFSPVRKEYLPPAGST